MAGTTKPNIHAYGLFFFSIPLHWSLGWQKQNKSYPSPIYLSPNFDYNCIDVKFKLQFNGYNIFLAPKKWWPFKFSLYLIFIKFLILVLAVNFFVDMFRTS
jgi:hypothetical protein